MPARDVENIIASFKMHRSGVESGCKILSCESSALLLLLSPVRAVGGE